MRPEGLKIERKHCSGEAVKSLLKPSKGIRDDIIRQGGVPKNHAKNNHEKIKELEKKFREKLDLKEETTSTFNIKKFTHVGPKVQTRQDVHTGSSLKKPTSSSTPPKDRSRSSSANSETNYIRRNAQQAKETNRKDSVDKTTTADIKRKTKIGQVPQYLLERKEEWAKKEEEKRNNMPDKNAPPGTVAVSEEERVTTLEYLKKKHENLVKQLNDLPMVVETYKLQERKKYIDSMLNEVEQAIQIYSRPKVYMAM